MTIIAKICIKLMNIACTPWGRNGGRDLNRAHNERVWRNWPQRISFIDDQYQMADFRYADRPLSHNGCGPIALYNLQLYLNDMRPVYSLPRLIECCECKGAVLSGALGTAPEHMIRIIKKLGYRAHLISLQPSYAYKNYFKSQNFAAIILLINDNNNILKGLHYTFLCRTPEGFRLYNGGNDKVYDSAETALDSINENGGRALSAILVKTKNHQP